jgi:hypothetical protein
LLRGRKHTLLIRTSIRERGRTRVTRRTVVMPPVGRKPGRARAPVVDEQ